MSLIQDIKLWLIVQRYKWCIWKDYKKRKFLNDLQIMDSDATINYIIKNNCSISRYGDGEFAVMAGGYNKFQRPNDYLANRLIEVINSPLPNILICIPYTFKTTKHLTIQSSLFISEFIYNNISNWCIPHIKTNIVYGDSMFTRFYMSRKDKTSTTMYRYLNQLKKIWEAKDILIVEGKYSRLGYNNDLFCNAKSISRILCPPQNAVDKYDEILATTITYAPNKLILLALGMAATILSYDLCKKGFQAIDIGHIDIEYEWYLKRAKTKIPINNKIVNEVAIEQNYMNKSINIDNNYSSSIITIIE